MSEEEVTVPLDELPAYIEGLFAQIAAKDAEIERLKEQLTEIAAMHDRRYDTGHGGSWAQIAYDMRSVAAQAAAEGGEE